jgi:pimeloyl-ACP methyl ester carboxylesterase
VPRQLCSAPPTTAEGSSRNCLMLCAERELRVNKSGEQCRSLRRLAWGLIAAALCCPAVCVAQAPKEEPPPEPKVVTLRTDDDVTIVATYYGSLLGKDAVPVMLLHSSKGNRADLSDLALNLQKAGHAVIVPDLRGHGESSHRGGGDRAVELRPADYQAMVEQDLETVKRFLRDRNNDGQLNIDKLCLVGVELGSVLAINFAARDWSWPVLAQGKQGQDVKALVLISPEWSFKGLRINEAVADPAVSRALAVLIVVGKGPSKPMQEAKRLYSAFEKHHPLPPPGSNNKQMLWLRTPPTTLQGMALVKEKSMLVDQMIAKFIELRLVDLAIPWSERRN